jgi:hypothetical protein
VSGLLVLRAVKGGGEVFFLKGWRWGVYGIGAGRIGGAAIQLNVSYSVLCGSGLHLRSCATMSEAHRGFEAQRPAAVLLAQSL